MVKSAHLTVKICWLFIMGFEIYSMCSHNFCHLILAIAIWGRCLSPINLGSNVLTNFYDYGYRYSQIYCCNFLLGDVFILISKADHL